MATTPNYGWVMPDPTDFVTSLPADFEIFGDAVDTTLEAIETKLDVITTEGDLVVGDASGDPVRVPVGTAGQVLASDGDTVEWVTPAGGGGMTLLASTTLSAATTFSFTSIPTTHKHLKLIWLDVTQSVNGRWRARFNADSTTNYTVAGISTTSGTTTTISQFYADSNSVSGGQDWQATITEASVGSPFVFTGELNIYRYAELEKRKFDWQSTGFSTTNERFVLGSGTYKDVTTAITSIDFTRSGTPTITGEFYLYGVD